MKRISHWEKVLYEHQYAQSFAEECTHPTPCKQTFHEGCHNDPGWLKFKLSLLQNFTYLTTNYIAKHLYINKMEKNK